MDLPSYDEAEQHPRAQGPGVLHIPPPPTYDASVTLPSTPPPSYGEAVEFVPDHFPVLTVPVSPRHNTGVFIHPATEVPVVVTQSISVTQSSPVVIYQPQPVPLVVPSQLTDSPAHIQCPHCGRTGTTLVSHVPSATAWCSCALLAFMGLICGFCLIPLLVRSCQDTHHSCPHCHRVVHVYKS
ncbi:lipopolysaccharide-induced tumor necrosis factor-alpha factor [Periophthalmus magnuspinnatus]|uniref:lipopolysaccharide-induced tumor necrosis factor-alpha factor n=1 Tax=Periophthalmus magnuspinnatus TaxID=409849 RepID=UPI00145AE5AA|nr:lipopolysaccharide-induced tumor necrosis factor-alpha factor [Periophthalmus magnuspinnatus]